jgi:hypothetical protein
MTPKRHFSTEIPQNIFEDGDLIDDSIGDIPMIGLKTPTGLRVRFMQRLSRLAAADVKMHEAEGQQAIEIHLSRNVRTLQVCIERDHELRQLVESMEVSFAVMSTRRTGTIAPHTHSA